MDVELIGTWANDAHIVVYFTHNNARGKYEAFSAALFDTTHEPTVISCSWGAPERLISSRSGGRDGPDVSGSGLDGHYHRLLLRR